MSLQNIGILDFGFRNGSTHSPQRIYSLIKEAILLEKLGFSKLWLAEHIGVAPYQIWSTPDVLIAIIAAYTKKINVGVAGTSVRYNNPIKVANDYQFLSTTFDSRIDLGFSKGRSLAYEEWMLTMNSFAPGKEESTLSLNDRIKLIIDLIHKQSELKKPNLWYLTATAGGYLAALEMSLNCCRTLFHLGSDVSQGNQQQDEYRKVFFDRYGRYPGSSISVAGTVQNNSKLITHIKEVHKNAIDVDRTICGPPEYVREKLHEYAKIYDVSEIIFYELSFASSDRTRSFKYLSNMIDN